MLVIWLNGTIAAGKSAVGRQLADLLPRAVFVDGDDHAGPAHLPNRLRWRMALEALLCIVARRGGAHVHVVAYPLDGSSYQRLHAVCGRGRRRLVVVNLAPPLALTLRGHRGRRLSVWEQGRLRAMRSAGYHRRTFGTFTLANAHPPAARTARRIARRVLIG